MYPADHYPLHIRWRKAVDVIDYAFQPIVNPLSGMCFAVEALIRNTTEAGFEGIDDFFERAYRENVLFKLEALLRRKAFAKFQQIRFSDDLRLFYNYDHRVLEMPDYHSAGLKHVLDALNMEPASLCLELTEKHRYRYGNSDGFMQGMQWARDHHIRIALDDFGAGFSSFELLYHVEPDFIKIDRFLLQDIHKDLKKKSYCTHIVALAHQLGISVVAEGVETLGEYAFCREIGVDLIQGYFVQRPTVKIEDLCRTYSAVREQGERMRNRDNSDAGILAREIEHIQTVQIDTPIENLFSSFRENTDASFFPVVDHTGVPLGLIHEKSIKRYIYSPFGKEVLRNKSLNQSLRKYMSSCPTVDINVPLEQILSIFVSNQEADGIIITRDGTYFGFLSSKSLLNTLNEKNLAFARDINPLTKLPGNVLINEYISQAYQSREHCWYLVYFDFDNFKPFNDRFGFRQGDRAIVLFAETLRKSFAEPDAFVGHIGGDDFFLGLRLGADARDTERQLRSRLEQLLLKFRDSVAPFYPPDEFRQGRYQAVDRHGIEREFPLLSVSAAGACMPPGDRAYCQDDVVGKLAELKKVAKSSSDNLALFTFF